MAAEWTGRFVAEKVKTHDKVAATELLGPQLVKIVRKELPDVVVATFAQECLNLDTVEGALNEFPQTTFVANISKESFITGGALNAAERRGVGIGSFGDLLSSLSLQDVSDYHNKEFDFVERGLLQHDRVTSFERLHDRQYRIERRGLDSLTAVFLNAYELTADHVRTARDRYGAFDLLVITNPNGSATGNATEAARAIGCQVHKWRTFLGRLNGE